MFNCEDFKIVNVRKASLSESELHLAERYTIITIGEKDADFYEVEINSKPIEKIINDTRFPLKKARLTGCNYLIKEYNYPDNHVFKNICYTNYERKQPAADYFKVIPI